MRHDGHTPEKLNCSQQSMDIKPLQRAKGVALYLVLTFGICWPIWFRMEKPQDSEPGEMLILYALGFAPALGSLAARRLVRAPSGTWPSLRPHLSNWRPYVYGLLYAPLIVVVSYGLVLLFSDSLPALPEPPYRTWYLFPLYVLLTALLVFGEELGWRGFLQPVLNPKHPALAAILTGLIWGVWHYPLLSRGLTTPRPLTDAEIIFFTVTTILLSFLFQALLEATGSLWAAVWAHGSFSSALFPVDPPLSVVALVILALAVIIRLTRQKERSAERQLDAANQSTKNDVAQ
jgi:membrane protease YdiL (CAAX protease family)